MKNVTIKQVQKLVALVNASGTISFNDNNDIKFSNGAVIVTENTTVANKIFRMLNLELSFQKTLSAFSGDEFDGVCQANQLGLNPYECVVMA